MGSTKSGKFSNGLVNLVHGEKQMKISLMLAAVIGMAGSAYAAGGHEAARAGKDFSALGVSASELRNSAAADASFIMPARAKGGGKLEFGFISEAERNAYITKASMWVPESQLTTRTMNFKTGPFSPMKYGIEEVVNCKYVPNAEAYDAGKANGTTPKFKCEGEDGKKFKVKYGEKNGEVITEVAATWLLTAIGAYADNMYPTRLNCPDCPSDPFKNEADRGAWQNGQQIAIEEKIGERIEFKANSGIGFNELYLAEDRVGAEALLAMAHFLGDTDNKAPNQALACAKKDMVKDPATGAAKCLKPIVYLQDSGVTFGGRGLFHNSRMNYDGWKGESVWLNPGKCIMRLHTAQTSSITGVDPSGRDMHQIGEQARQMLVRRFSLLSREQVVDIFTAARAFKRAPEHSAEEWADLFLDKVEQLRNPMGANGDGNFACPFDIVPPNSAQPAVPAR